VLIGASVEGATLADAWSAGLGYFAEPSQLSRHDSDRGIAFDLPGLTLSVASAEDLSLPARYAYPTLVNDYVERLVGADTDKSMLHKRLSSWEVGDQMAIDQFETIADLLRRFPDTRAAAFSLWRPDVDLTAAYAVSPVGGCFRILDECLHLLLVARSVDYWIGAVPELVSFGQLQKELARRLNVPVGGIVYHMWSAHLYENDYLAQIATR
jgi:hypothetical protein